MFYYNIFCGTTHNYLLKFQYLYRIPFVLNYFRRLFRPKILVGKIQLPSNAKNFRFCFKFFCVEKVLVGNVWRLFSLFSLQTYRKYPYLPHLELIIFLTQHLQADEDDLLIKLVKSSFFLKIGLDGGCYCWHRRRRSCTRLWSLWRLFLQLQCRWQSCIFWNLSVSVFLVKSLWNITSLFKPKTSLEFHSNLLQNCTYLKVFFSNVWVSQLLVSFFGVCVGETCRVPQ